MCADGRQSEAARRRTELSCFQTCILLQQAFSRACNDKKTVNAMRIFPNSLLISLLVVDVKGSSLNEAMAKKIKNDAGFEPKEPCKHKSDIKVGLHVDSLLAVSAHLRPHPHLRTARPQHNRLSTHPQHTLSTLTLSSLNTPSASSAHTLSTLSTLSTVQFLYAMTPRQYSDYRVDENCIACPFLRVMSPLEASRR